MQTQKIRRTLSRKNRTPLGGLATVTVADFTIAGRPVSLDRETVLRRMSGVVPESVQKHAVDVSGVLYPVVQVLEVASGVPRRLTRSAHARDVLSRLGFKLLEIQIGSQPRRVGRASTQQPAGSSAPTLSSVSIADAAVQLSTPRVRLRDLIKNEGLLELEGTGLYAIYGQESVWHELGLSPVDERPLYLGKAESHSIANRALRTHFASGRTGSSTVRRSFAALLHDDLRLTAIPRNPENPERFSHYGLGASDDEKLTRWMIDHLELASWVGPPGTVIVDVERAMLNTWLPALNLDHCASPWRALVSARRAGLAIEARTHGC